MKLTFNIPSVREICQSLKSAVKRFDENIAQDFLGCIADFEAAESFSDLPVIPDIIENCDPPECRINFNSGAIFFTTSHIDPPLINGHIDWPKVKSIKILRIEP